MKEFITIGYEWKELNQEAKEQVKKWYMDSLDVWNVHDMVMEELKELFPNSNLDVQISLSYCQGDGLNIYGAVKMTDFLPLWKATEEEKHTIREYIEQSTSFAYLVDNPRYGYSCKFVDRQNVEYTVSQFTEGFPDMDAALVRMFCIDLINYFEELDRKWEKFGYEYLYECSDEEVQEFCECNEYYFDRYGTLIG
jgi:hypothetical protein